MYLQSDAEQSKFLRLAWSPWRNFCEASQRQPWILRSHAGQEEKKIELPTQVTRPSEKAAWCSGMLYAARLMKAGCGVPTGVAKDTELLSWERYSKAPDKIPIGQLLFVAEEATLSHIHIIISFGGSLKLYTHDCEAQEPESSYPCFSQCRQPGGRFPSPQGTFMVQSRYQIYKTYL